MAISLASTEILLQMLKRYDEVKDVHQRSPEEFVKECICTQKLFVEADSETIVDAFLKICSMQTFLTSVLSVVNVSESNGAFVLLYLLLFNISQATANIFKDCLKICLPDIKERKKLVKFFFQQDRNEASELIMLTANKIYDVEYSSFIAKSMMERLEMMNQLRDEIMNELGGGGGGARYKRHKDNRTITLCKPPSFMINPMPPVPENTVVQNSCTDLSPFSCGVISDSPEILNKKLMEIERRKRLRKRQWKSLEVIEPQSKLSVIPEIAQTPKKKKPRNAGLPTFKVNKAAVLRYGARLDKNLKNANDFFENLMSGVIFNPIAYEVDVEMKKMEMCENEWRDLERKHLMVLMAHEDAKLAKMAMFERKQLLAHRVKVEKEKWLKKLKQVRKEQMERLKCMVEANTNALEVAKEAHVKCIEEKHKIAKCMNEELRQMKGQVIQQRQEELKQKVELIREIKRLEQIKREMKNDKKVLNKEQTSGSGLLCEMSLHQLKDALKKIKVEVEKQVKCQNEKIQREKCRQQQLLNEMVDKMERFKNLSKLSANSRTISVGQMNSRTSFMSSNRSRSSSVRRPSVTTLQRVEEDKDLIELRNKLEYKRQLIRFKSFSSA